MRHDDAGVARGSVVGVDDGKRGKTIRLRQGLAGVGRSGAAGADGARRGTMLQARQVEDLHKASGLDLR